MESIILRQKTEELSIAPELIVREEWEMKILNQVSQSKIGQDLVFKGGTALRLAYNSPRFSEDLDFDIAKKIKYSDFQAVVNNIIKSQNNYELKDLAEKRNTFLAQIGIQDENLPRSFSIKIEISQRVIRKKMYYETKLITSPVSSIQVLLAVARLDEIKKEKQQAVKTRRQARDLFDLWYIAQFQREPWQRPKSDFSLAEIKKELNKFLPPSFQAVYDELV